MQGRDASQEGNEMREVAVVLSNLGKPIFWHDPAGSNRGAIPDSSSLWNCLWQNRDILYGVAHTHPGSGQPGPSQTDTTTFSAIEKALGKRLFWPIVTLDHVGIFHMEAGQEKYVGYLLEGPGLRRQKHWIDKLRLLSYGSKEERENG